MTCEAETEQIVSTALTLQDEYLKFTPRNQNIACHAEIIGIFHDIHPTVEIKEPHQDKSALQETLVTLLCLGNPTGTPGQQNHEV
uniref:Siamois homeodomain 1p.S n=1 Tax=Xenopus laevis TaxID=8355 RepID=A0A1B4ZDL2_XENLA|nr:siamois homeodomain 1p.S [Xenopus laevis]